ncbi:MAG: hypothetical protein RMJ28_05090 [Nitrososphaerota archaeon]|nr:hypothetical protein [Candidatus Calditenuaceae archaeon]MDW8073594.1 hypothetical protein [Nitrososphaerota archaeon]
MLEEYRSLSGEERFKHVDILKRFIASLTTSAADRKNNWFAVRSFYEYHRLALPKLPRGEMTRLFRPSEEDKARAVELGLHRVEDVRRLVSNSSQPYKAAIMTMFQSAMGPSALDQFNLRAWKRLVNDLDKPGPLRIDLVREKTSRADVKRYYTFVGEDAEALIRDWLSIRPRIEMDALFIVYNKTKKTWVPLTGLRLSETITKIAKKIGLVKPNGLRRYHIHAHGFRDLFKCLCTLSGVNQVASEFFLGHVIDKL